jgi:hypothetical protein
MDCDLQNPEPAANNRFEYLQSLASNAVCIQCSVPLQTSDIRDVLPPFAMMISLQLTSDP